MKYFKGINEVALSEEDVLKALEEFFQKRFKTDANFYISELKHCRSGSQYCLRFKINQSSYT